MQTVQVQLQVRHDSFNEHYILWRRAVVRQGILWRTGVQTVQTVRTDMTLMIVNKRFTLAFNRFTQLSRHRDALDYYDGS